MQFCRRAAARLFRNRYSSPPKSVPVAVGNFARHKITFEELAPSSILLAVGWFGKSSERPKEENVDLISTVDNLYKQNKFREVYDLLKDHKDSDDVEILWRLCRVGYNISQEQATPDEEKKRLVYEAFELISKALALNDAHFASHKWMSILLDAKSGYDGLKARISNLETVKQHLLRASELNQRDATTLYMIGLWQVPIQTLPIRFFTSVILLCYQIADMPWYQRKIASTVFAKPPDSSYEEALKYFVRAEEVDPRFYSQNLLMLGKTHLKLNEEDKAKYYLDLASNYPASTDDDRLAKSEATELLKKLKPTKTPAVA